MIKSQNKKKFSISEVENILKKQKIIFAVWNCSSKKDDPYQLFYLPLKKLFGKAILFDPRVIRRECGSKKMDNLFFSLIEKEKPEYAFINIRRDELTIETMEKIKKISPNTKIISWAGDDDKDFEPLKRYQALFADCTFVAQPNYLKDYYKDGVKNAFPHIGINIEIFKPMNLKKIYDVTFVGKPSNPRLELVNFLIKNKINIKLFGKGWENYSELREFYIGPLETNNLVKMVNQSKINLAFSKNKDGIPHFKGRVNAFAACKSFSLVDYFDGYLKFFKNNKEIVMFKDNQELLEKINYYLKHEKEREKIAKKAYKRVINEHDIFKEFKELFKTIMENPETFSQKFPKVKANLGKIITLTKEDMKKSNKEIQELLNEFEYISFSEGNSIPLKYKDYLQAYSLKKTKKQISCGDYYVYDKILGNYLMTNIWKAFHRLKKDKFNQMLSLNQIMVTKRYFIENINKFKYFFNGKRIDIINEKNTCFISIPLVRINKINKMNFEVFYSVFEKDFILKTYFLFKQNKLFTSSYFYKMLYLMLKNSLLRKSFFKFIRDKKNLNQLKWNLSN